VPGLVLRGAVTRWPIAIPLVALMFTYSAMWVRFGWPAHGGDTPRLLAEAHNLATGQPFGPSGMAFLLPHVLFAATIRLGLPLGAYIAIQVLLAGVATCALFGLVMRAGGGVWAAVGASTAWALNPLAQQMNVYLLSDGLYQSLLIITVYCVLRGLQAQSAAAVLVAALSLVAIALCRPQGQLWPTIVAVILLMAMPRTRLMWTTAGALIVLQALLLGLTSRYAVQMNMVQHFERGQVIWGYEGLRQTMPAWRGEDDAGLRSVVEYCLQHPLASAGLMATRMVVELGNIRPFYSMRHNLSSVVFYWPLYPLAIVGLRTRLLPAAKMLSLTAFIAHALFVGATHADSDGRWFLQILPLLLMWASIGAATLLALTPATARS
jgi:hypothetical protein